VDLFKYRLQWSRYQSAILSKGIPLTIAISANKILFIKFPPEDKENNLQQ